MHACTHCRAHTDNTPNARTLSVSVSPSGRPSPTFTHKRTFHDDLSSCYTLQARFKIFYKQHLTTQRNQIVKSIEKMFLNTHHTHRFIFKNSKRERVKVHRTERTLARTHSKKLRMKNEKRKTTKNK